MLRTTVWLGALISATASLGVLFGSVGADEERAMIERAAMDYIEAFYEVKPESIERSVHPQLTKYGFYQQNAGGDYTGTGMDFESAKALASKWNEGGKQDVDSAPKKVEILDQLDQIATVKVTAKWGVDYLQLAKYDGKWKILHVIWQTLPENVSD